MSLLRLRNGSIRKYSVRGGYPIYYVSKGYVLCPTCADKTVEEGEAEDEDFEPSVNYESRIHCDQCSEQIESAYGVADEN